MSSREGFSPRSRTWIKNSCATSVNTTKNPKPLNGSTSIQPIESLANQLLQLTRKQQTINKKLVGKSHRSPATRGGTEVRFYVARSAQSIAWIALPERSVM